MTRSLPARVADEVRFFRHWVGRPLTTGAVSPSGKALARLMASHVDPADPLPVLELGPGTGPVTRALLARGIDRGRIVAVEYNPDFCVLLERRFPGIRIVQGDAYDLARTLPAELAATPFGAIVSSLPLMAKPPPARRAFMEQALALLAPGGALVQFSYALTPPVAPVAGRFSVERSKWVALNLPPARVWLYRRSG